MWAQLPPEPPPDFVAFVARRLPDARARAAELTGGDRFADEVYPDALADVAARWCRRWRRDPDALLIRRLAVRGRRWRAEQLYPVEVTAVRASRRAPAATSVALRKAGLLPPTSRPAARPVAEAAIAWSMAYRRQQWWRWARTLGTSAAVLGALAELARNAPT